MSTTNGRSGPSNPGRSAQERAQSVQQRQAENSAHAAAHRRSAQLQASYSQGGDGAQTAAARDHINANRAARANATQQAAPRQENNQRAATREMTAAAQNRQQMQANRYRELSANQSQQTNQNNNGRSRS